jgi:hypothetical protein
VWCAPADDPSPSSSSSSSTRQTRPQQQHSVAACARECAHQHDTRWRTLPTVTKQPHHQQPTTAPHTRNARLAAANHSSRLREELAAVPAAAAHAGSRLRYNRPARPFSAWFWGFRVSRCPW